MTHTETMPAFSEQEISAIIDLASLVYQFCQVERALVLPDGITPETDADHTIMLQFMTLVLIPRYFPQLDLGCALQYALIHDLPEVYAGDTATLQIDDAGRRAKEAREALAVAQIETEFGESFPELVQLIQAYERLDTPEATFVKMLDKLMPTFCHIHNQGEFIHRSGLTLEANRLRSATQTQYYQSTGYGRDNPALLALRKALQPFFEESAFGVSRQD